ncbi:SDR family oxidoreductase [Actinospica durhamensis]|uniref:SDR family oxidoreductase n=1 Tax=Actinospica durhamensis TaxID=1508375 RepID=A0A941EJX6_9ACTN|nr:SDR family oxidoreductase [Actinospica durhamensis]MBR7832223.1 SDR family oxidoreductase [Actinospica durhamensis]
MSRSSKLTGGTALVTGAGSGIGEASALRLAADGWSVVAADVDDAALKALRGRDARIRALYCDVQDAESVAEVAASIGPVDRLVHAAAVSRLGSALDQPREEFDAIWRINFVGTVQVVRAVVPGMIERGRGEVVLYSSLGGWVPARKLSAYASSKAAVNAFADVLAQECRGTGVTIRCVCPSQVDTPQYRRISAEDPAATAHRKGMPTDVVVDAVERSLGRPSLYVFPGATAKAAILLKRHAPRTFAKILDRQTR